MNRIVNSSGAVDYGIYDEEIGELNYRDYKLRTPMGIPLPGFIKKLKFNQFHFFGLMGPELMAGLAVVDLKFIGNGFFYIYDRKSGAISETKKLSIAGKSFSIRNTPSSPESSFKTNQLCIELKKKSVFAEGRNIVLDLTIDGEHPNPLRICSRAGYRGWVYTEKTSPIKVSGRVKLNNKNYEISSPHYQGLMDWTGGYMRKYTFWNWAAIAFTLEDGRSLGMNLSCGVNETGFTENAFWVDNEMTKVDMVNFTFDARDINKPWRIKSWDKRVDLEFRPEKMRGEKIQAIILASRFSQLMGTFEGKLVTETGETIEISSCPGWAEDHYAKW